MSQNLRTLSLSLNFNFFNLMIVTEPTSRVQLNIQSPTSNFKPRESMLSPLMGAHRSYSMAGAPLL